MGSSVSGKTDVARTLALAAVVGLLGVGCTQTQWCEAGASGSRVVLKKGSVGAQPDVAEASRMLVAAIEDIEVIPEPRRETSTMPTASRTRKLNSAGPRFGVLQVTGEAVETLAQEYEADPTLTAWGWQWEYEYQTSDGGPTGLVEIVPLVIGLDQGLGFPSVNTLVGMRTAGGSEFCVGPNASLSGVGLTVAFGHTFKAGPMNLPVNLAWVGGRDSDRFSLTFGWNIRQ